MRDLSATLLAKQKTSSYAPYIPVTIGEDSYGVGRILDIDCEGQPHRQDATIVLNNADGTLTAKSFQGKKVTIGWGLVTSEGNESSAAAPMRVMSQRFHSSPGRLTCELRCIGPSSEMAEDKADERYVPTTETPKTLLSGIYGATLAPYDQCSAYTVQYDGDLDDLIDVIKPEDSFRIYVNTSRTAAGRRLLDFTYCVMRPEGDEKLHIFKPTTTGESYDSEYSLAAGAHHFFAKGSIDNIVIPNYIVVRSKEGADPFYSGYAQDTASVNAYKAVKQYYVFAGLTSNAQATAIAEAILAKIKMGAQTVAAEVPMNCGAEIYDYVKITDSREGTSVTGNIGYIRRHYSWAKAEYRMFIGFGGWLSMRKPLSEMEVGGLPGEEQDYHITDLSVENAYIQNLVADQIDLYWLDPEGNIDLDKIGDNLDNLVDGETYARVKSLHLDDGQIKLDENVYYSPGYNASEKRRTFTSTPTTPYDLGDLWFQAGIIKRCTTARASGAYVAGDWTTTTLDDVANGATFRRIKGTQVTADGVVVLDDVYAETENASYGLVLASHLTAGKLKLTSETVFDGEWYNESGVEIDATHGINIYGVNNALTTRATKTGAIQCYVGADGKLYAGGGAVRLAADGIKVYGQNFRLYHAGGSWYTDVYCEDDGFSIVAGHDIALLPATGKLIYAGKGIVPNLSNSYDLGKNNLYWNKLWCNAIDIATNGDIIMTGDLGNATYHPDNVHATTFVDHTPKSFLSQDAMELLRQIGEDAEGKLSIFPASLRGPNRGAKGRFVAEKDRGYSLGDAISLIIAASRQLEDRVKALEAQRA